LLLVKINGDVGAIGFKESLVFRGDRQFLFLSPDHKIHIYSRCLISIDKNVGKIDDLKTRSLTSHVVCVRS
jgi:hypothetical protein